MSIADLLNESLEEGIITFVLVQNITNSTYIKQHELIYVFSCLCKMRVVVTMDEYPELENRFEQLADQFFPMDLKRANQFPSKYSFQTNSSSSIFQKYRKKRGASR